MRILEWARSLAKRMTCQHQYELQILAKQYAVFKCTRCGKETQLNGIDIPDMLLRWGYARYHGEASAETMQLLKEQGIAKNNTIMVPERMVYIVSYFEKMEERINRDGRPGGVDLGDVCTKGIYFTENQLEDSLRGPIASCFCTDYPYASVECYESGLANPKKHIRFFQYDSQKRAYQAIDVPTYVRRQIKTIAIGLY